MLRINDLTFSYKRSQWPVVRNLSLEIEPGNVYGLLGKNGVGKTTLLQLIAGVLTPIKGEVLLNGVNTRRRLPSTLSELFIMPEEVTLPSMSLQNFIKINSPFYPRFSHEDLDRYLELFDMSKVVNLGGLSMGQKKKVYISFALACNTSLLLMDEPANGLDITSKGAFRRVIAGGMTDERSILISTHQVRDLESMLDNLIIMDESRIVLNKSIGEIASRLKFMVSDSPNVIKSSLLSVPSIEGVKVVTVNDDGAETEVDVEMLFNLVTSNPGVIDYVFRNK